MKDFSKNYGWHIKCIGGPLDGMFTRTMNLHTDPQEEAASARKRFTLVGDYSGWYVRHAARKKDKLKSLKEIKHKGITIVAWEYHWEEVTRPWENDERS
jgi:hypothetical protein